MRDDNDRGLRRSAPLAVSDPELASVIELRLALPIRGSDDLVELMNRVAQLAVEHIVGADHAGITALIGHTSPFTIAPTDERVGRFDRSQYRNGDGPCLRAARTDTVVEIDLAEMGRLWPDLAINAHECGISRVLASPLHQRETTVGSLNLYTDSGITDSAVTAYPSGTSSILVVLLRHLDRGLEVYDDSLTDSRNARALQASVESRAIIDRAIGVIAALTECTRDAAADLLATKARTENIGRRQAAERVLHDRSV